MFRKPLHSLLLLASAPALLLACSGETEEPPAPAEPTPTAALIIDRASFDFGDLEVGRGSAEQVFTLRNASPVAVEAVNVTVDSAAFVITATTCERFLDAGRECEVRVKFSPGLAGSHEAHLRTQGAPEGDQAVLKGSAFAYVDVRHLAANTSVIAGTDDWSCGAPCRQLVRTAEVTLRVAPAGFPRWGGACEPTARTCTLRMDRTHVVSLEEVAPAVVWESRWGQQVRTVAVAPDGDIIVHDDFSLTRLSGTGQERWRREGLGGSGLGLDAEGNSYVLAYTSLLKLDARGNTVWNASWSGVTGWGQRLAVSPSGDAYVIVGVGNSQDASHFRLYAFSAAGTERWSRTFDEGPLNYVAGLGVDASGAVYVSGNVYRRDGTPTGLISEKRYFRKLSASGELLWEQQESWFDFIVSPAGVTSVIVSTRGTAPGSFFPRVLDPNGQTTLAPTGPMGPGVVDTQGFTAPSVLLLGGHQELPSSTLLGRGWFSTMNIETRGLGPILYIDGPPNLGARVTSLALAPSGRVVVGVSHGGPYESREGVVRVYDPRVLTVGLP